ncbi:hypothetical protein L3Q82_010092, partial [Scortum barcoo]
MTLLLLASSQMGTTESTEDLFRTLRTGACGTTSRSTLGKTKELVVDFRRRRATLRLHRLDWSDNTNALVKKGNSRLFLLRRLRSFGVQGLLECRDSPQDLLMTLWWWHQPSFWDSLLGQQHHGQGQEENGQTGEEGQLCPGMPSWTQWR